jgi:hypothetical protein
MNGGDGEILDENGQLGFWWGNNTPHGDGKSNGVAYLIPPGTTSHSGHPEYRLKGWKVSLSFKNIADGTTHTMLIGEKFVHPDHQGTMLWGDHTWWSDDEHSSTVRLAGDRFPLAQSDDDETVFQDYVNMPFGSPHPIAKHLSAKRETLLRFAIIEPVAAVLTRRKARLPSVTARPAQGR